MNRELNHTPPLNRSRSQRIDANTIFLRSRVPIGPTAPISAPRSLLNSYGTSPRILSYPSLPNLLTPKEALPLPAQHKTFMDELIERYSPQGANNMIDFVNQIQRQRSLSVFWDVKKAEGYQPEAREGATVNLINCRLFMFGGQCRTRFNDIRVLNYQTWYWDRLAFDTHEGDPPPEERVGHSGSSYKNLLIIYGGRGPYNSALHIRNCYPRIHVFDTLTKIWRTYKPLGRGPEGRRLHGACVVGNSMVIFGGMDSNGKILADLHGLNLDIMQWFVPKVEKGTVKPSARHSFSLTSVYHPSIYKQSHDIFTINYPRDEEIWPRKVAGIYLFGGVNSQGPTNEIWFLQVKRKHLREEEGMVKWIKLEPSGTAPSPRYGHSAVLSGHSIFFIGGRNDSFYTCSERFDEIAAFNFQSCRWDSISVSGSPPSLRWGACAASIGTKILYFGGMSLENFCDFKVYALETEQNYAGELSKNWEDEEKVRRAKRDATKRRLTQGGILIPESESGQEIEQQDRVVRKAAMLILNSKFN